MKNLTIILILLLLSCTKNDNYVVKQNCSCKYDENGIVDMEGSPTICKQVCSKLKVGQAIELTFRN